MTVRSFDQDVADVLAVQAGDSAAWLRIRRGYSQNVSKVARKYEGVFDEAEAVDIAWSAIAEHVMTVSPEDAKFLRNKITVIALEALDVEMRPELSRMSMSRMRKAHKMMQAEDGSWAQGNGVTMQEAAKANDLSVGALITYVAMERVESFDKVFDEAFDDENPYNQDLAGGYRVDDVDAKHDPELSNRVSQCHVTDVAVGSERQSHSVKAQVRDALDLLPTSQRAVIDLFMTGMNDSEIAAELNLSPKTVNTHRLRAFDSLRSSISI
jgi:hypothetical protein